MTLPRTTTATIPAIPQAQRQGIASAVHTAPPATEATDREPSVSAAATDNESRTKPVAKTPLDELANEAESGSSFKISDDDEWALYPPGTEDCGTSVSDSNVIWSKRTTLTWQSSSDGQSRMRNRPTQNGGEPGINCQHFLFFAKLGPPATGFGPCRSPFFMQPRHRCGYAARDWPSRAVLWHKPALAARLAHRGSEDSGESLWDLGQHRARA